MCMIRCLTDISADRENQTWGEYKKSLTGHHHSCCCCLLEPWNSSAYCECETWQEVWKSDKYKHKQPWKQMWRSIVSTHSLTESELIYTTNIRLKGMFGNRWYLLLVQRKQPISFQQYHQYRHKFEIFLCC